MNKHLPDPEFKKTIMRGTAAEMPLPPQLVMPKFDGLYARFIPGYGFVSKGGKLWVKELVQDFFDPKLNMVVDGEFWIPGAKLQDIQTAIGVTRDEPGPRHNEVVFVAFDTPKSMHNAAKRLNNLVMQISGLNNPRIQVTPVRYCRTREEQLAAHKHFVNHISPEGSMHLQPLSGYVPGVSNSLIKVKEWITGEFKVIEYLAGEGKYAGTLGALFCETADKIPFNVGSFEISDAARAWMWKTKPNAMVKLRYKEVSAAGVPIGAIYQAVEEE